MTPRIGSACSGYGGLEMGLASVIGGSVAWHVEIDKHPAAVLAARFPGVPNLGDLTAIDWTRVEPVDIFTAGYPCQPFSAAGKRLGAADARHLWPSIAHAIGVLRPGLVFLENVANHLVLGFDAVLADLAALGYDATWGVVRASDAGACHGRARLFVAAHPLDGGRWRPERVERRLGSAECLTTAATDTRREGWRFEGGSIGSPAQSPGPSGGPAGSHSGLAAHADHDAARHRRQLGDSDRRRAQPAQRGGVAADAPSNGWDEGRTEPARQLRRPNAAVRCHASCAVDRDWRTADGADYGPAIRRWHDLTRCVPDPTEPGGRGGRRLSPRLNEWMMGLPDGWVTDILPRNPALKCLGNGVVPQQAALAVRTLLPLACEVAA